MEKVESLSVEGTEGLRVGDRVIVLVDSEFYEGFYVVNHHNGGCILGIRLPPKDDRIFGKDEQNAFIDLLRKGKDLRQLTPEEMNLWNELDPKGIGCALIREIETKHLKWDKEGK